MEIQHQIEEVNVVNNIEHRYQARLVILDDLMDAIFTAIYDIYNFLALEKWEQILPQDLDTLKPVLESLRNFHCPLNHNEDMTHMKEQKMLDRCKLPRFPSHKGWLFALKTLLG